MKEIDVLIRARYSLLYVVSPEENRVTRALAEIAHREGKRLLAWTETMGLYSALAQVPPEPDEATTDPIAALEKIRLREEPAIYLLKDFPFFLEHRYDKSSTVIRKLRDLANALRTTYATVVLLSPRLFLPPELEKEVTVLDFDLPGLPELGELLDQALKALEEEPEVEVDLSEEDREAVLKAALGLTLDEAENVFARCVVEKKGFDVRDILAEKKQIIRKSGALEYYEATERMDNIGGLDTLKGWLRRRALAFSEKARDFGLPAPKGVLLLGVQGCGKSLTAKAVAGLWKMPLLRLDVGSVFAGLVGSSEENMRRAIKMAEAVSPAVLWVDEIEKGLSGARSSGQLDSGVTARVFSTLTTWLQEKTKPVFVVATANDISALPPELLRKGRFDEIFFVDLPGEAERREVFTIHLRKRKRNPEDFDLARLARESKGFSGAEIEQAVISALYYAFEHDREITTEDILGALQETVPLSVTMREEIGELRKWAQGRARFASAGAEG
ncbi:MAG: AAA family ATPase [Armatimonadetes bacterium]|nr:AAA family ATPase [Armatimonadota bacterium]NIM23828.1 AAA family ATPase [Armatimonadota bacterium]NIM67707.1 AAA family ATPase [Armatimonadota bacterium]NIM76216.1 AAA family ATPase [Armatimonadota bacterium]NIN05909.1 AAA family ATPase [Armatimonadota bacterium]